MWRNHSLSIVMFSAFALFWTGQAAAGYLHERDERAGHGESPPALAEYLSSGSFWESTSENWESEFLQMAAFVWLTVFLRQRGSSQSKPVEGEAESDRPPRPRPGAPGPVHRGGLALALYERSLTLALAGLFLASFALHAVSGRASFNEERAAHGEAALSLGAYLASSRFWWESLQNWQSEFLAVGAIVVLSVFLRPRGSPESKPVDAPHSETEG
jgi:hypothetical protein